MALPKWAGRDKRVGPYRLRVFWFRVLIVAGMIGAGSFIQSWIQNDNEAEMIASLMRLSLHDVARSQGANIETFPVPPSEARRLARQAKALAANEGLREKLEARRISVQFTETPFFDAIQSLREKTAFNIVISEDARQLIRSESVRVTLTLKDISIKNAIQLVLSSHQHLEYSIEQGIIYVSQGGLEDRDLRTRFYNVRDITNPPAGVRLGEETLLNLLNSTVLGEERGERSILFADNILSCRLSKQGQESVLQFLETLRGHHRR
ncbi:MAG: hypothetical protein P1V97_29010, partial [Planctomycetota bacterium]|nr:hypothetical protein [Planctomycetota bacterium]